MKGLPYILSSILFLSSATLLHAQEEDLSTRYTSHALTFGVGLTNVLDTYLTPLEYKGEELRLQRETLRQTHFAQGKIYVQTLLNVHASYSQNTSKSGEMYDALLNWNLSYLYHFQLNEHLQILAGPTWEVNGGGIYNHRNSNNPAQAKVSTDLGASGLLLYRFHALRKNMMLRYQISLPLVGLQFSPEFGESYYEIFELKHSGHNVCFTTPFSSPSLRQTLSVDFPVHSTLLRVSYIGDFQQSKVNDLKSHVWSHALMIGFVKNFQLLKPGDKNYEKTPFQP